jgi:hypothetical protein
MPRMTYLALVASLVACASQAVAGTHEDGASIVIAAQDDEIANMREQIQRLQQENVKLEAKESKATIAVPYVEGVWSGWAMHPTLRTTMHPTVYPTISRPNNSEVKAAATPSPSASPNSLDMLLKEQVYSPSAWGDFAKEDYSGGRGGGSGDAHWEINSDHLFNLVEETDYYYSGSHGSGSGSGSGRHSVGVSGNSGEAPDESGAEYYPVLIVLVLGFLLAAYCCMCKRRKPTVGHEVVQKAYETDADEHSEYDPHSPVWSMNSTPNELTPNEMRERWTPSTPQSFPAKSRPHAEGEQDHAFDDKFFAYCSCCLPICFRGVPRQEIFRERAQAELRERKVELHLDGKTAVNALPRDTPGYWPDLFFFIFQTDHFLSMFYSHPEHPFTKHERKKVSAMATTLTTTLTTPSSLSPPPLSSPPLPPPPLSPPPLSLSKVYFAMATTAVMLSSAYLPPENCKGYMDPTHEAYAGQHTYGRQDAGWTAVCHMGMSPPNAHVVLIVIVALVKVSYGSFLEYIAFCPCFVDYVGVFKDRTETIGV